MIFKTGYYKTVLLKKYENRTVNSVYFDDLYNTSANDNLSGISKREKYRLRWYNNNFVNNLKFEVKKRINRLNFKEFLIFLVVRQPNRHL